MSLLSLARILTCCLGGLLISIVVAWICAVWSPTRPMSSFSTTPSQDKDWFLCRVGPAPWAEWTQTAASHPTAGYGFESPGPVPAKPQSSAGVLSVRLASHREEILTEKHVLTTIPIKIRDGHGEGWSELRLAR